MREMMNCYDVNIRVPSQEAKSDLVIISGVPSNVEAAKVRNCANTQYEQFYIRVILYNCLFPGWSR